MSSDCSAFFSPASQSSLFSKTLLGAPGFPFSFRHSLSAFLFSSPLQISLTDFPRFWFSSPPPSFLATPSKLPFPYPKDPAATLSSLLAVFFLYFQPSCSIPVSSPFAAVVFHSIYMGHSTLEPPSTLFYNCSQRAPEPLLASCGRTQLA